MSYSYAERALEAVRAEANATIKAYWDGNVPNMREFVRRLDAALSAASPTASDEPARCPHGMTEAHWTGCVCPSGLGECEHDCPGPAASGTP